MNVLYRNQTEAPAAMGWFYCRDTFAPEKGLRPVEVKERLGGLLAFDGGTWWDLSEYDWFGPVAECYEG